MFDIFFFFFFFFFRVQRMLKERSEYAHVLVDIYNFIGDFISDMSTTEDILQVSQQLNLLMSIDPSHCWPTKKEIFRKITGMLHF